MEPETKLAICLRFLAGGDPLDLKLIYDVSKSYVYSCVWRVVDAINATFPVEFPLADVGKLRVLEAEFACASRQGVWRGQVGCVDGVHFAMQAPTKEDVPDPLKYYVARKAKYALLCLAVCAWRLADVEEGEPPCSITHGQAQGGVLSLARHVRL